MLMKSGKDSHAVHWTQRLKGFMEGKRWGITDLSLESGVATGTLNHWVKGDPKKRPKSPTVEKVQPVCQALGVTLDEVFGSGSPRTADIRDILKQMSDALLLAHRIQTEGDAAARADAKTVVASSRQRAKARRPRRKGTRPKKQASGE